MPSKEKVAFKEWRKSGSNPTIKQYTKRKQKIVARKSANIK
jgi:hypothetical protein